MAAPQGSFAPVVASAEIQGVSSLTTSRHEREQRDRQNRDLEPQKWVGSMDVTQGGATLSRPASRLSRHSSLRAGWAPLSGEEEDHINRDWAMSEEVSTQLIRNAIATT
jgi:hypothetical protein